MQAVEWQSLAERQIYSSVYETALESFECALSLNPELLESWEGKIEALKQLQRYREAEVALEQAIALGGNLKLEADYWQKQGYQQFLARELENAIICYDNALRYQPEKALAWHRRGVVLIGLREYSEAVVSFDKALDHQQDFPAVWWQLRSSALKELNRYEDLINRCEQVVKYKPDYIEAWIDRGSALAELKKYEEAISNYDQALHLNPDLSDVWNSRAAILNICERYWEAIESAERSIALQPEVWKGWFIKGLALRHAGHCEDAIASYDRALALNPVNHNAWLDRGFAFNNLERYEEALISYDKAIEYKPDYAQAWNNRGAVLEKLGRCEEALVSYGKAVEHKPDYVQVWRNRGFVLVRLERYEEAIADFEQVLVYEANDADAWNNKGFALSKLGHHEEALSNYDQALQHKPDYTQAWKNRGFTLCRLDQHQESITSFDQALRYQPDAPEIWGDYGAALGQLGRYEESLVSLDRALQYKPSDAMAWNNRGCALLSLERDEEALVDCERALQYKPDLALAWTNRGAVLGALGRYEEAVIDYDQSLRYKSDYVEAWHGRALALTNLGQDEEAINSCDKALHYKPDFADAWIGRGISAVNASLSSSLRSSQKTLVIHSLPPQMQNSQLDLRGYEGQIACIQEGFKYAQADSENCGKLHQGLGEAHRHWGNRQENPRPYWRKATASYEAALKIFTAEAFPQARLELLTLLLRTYGALQINNEVVAALLRQGTALLRRILAEATSDPQKKRLGLQFANFGQITVDLLLQKGEIVKALETAEADKNWLMTWLLRWQDPDDIPTATYDAMRQLLRPHSAIVYWHLSADALTTFILRWDKAQPTTLSRATDDDIKSNIQQVRKLETWLKNWNQTYQFHIDKSKGSLPSNKSDWFKALPDQLHRLAEILQVDAIKAQLLPDIAHLTLVPHRDLHRLPLPYFFSDYQTTTLPSLQLGQTLRPAITQLDTSSSALTITAPNHADLGPLYHAEAETHLINQILAKSYSVETVTAGKANHSTVSQALANPHLIFHFNGHAAYNFTNPKDSALALTGSDNLTVQDLSQISLEAYSLVTLASCETALSGNQTITAEYVGIASAFLGQDIPHVLSTFWTVESAASMVFMVEFYTHLHLGPADAYHHSRRTLRDLTVAQLKTRYDYWLTLDLSVNVREFLEDERNDLDTIDSDQRRYRHPYYWAAFTLMGLGGPTNALS